MSPDDVHKQKNHRQPKPGLKQVLEGVLERLREGLNDIAEGLRPQEPQPIPIPIPVQRPRRR